MPADPAVTSFNVLSRWSKRKLESRSPVRPQEPTVQRAEAVPTLSEVEKLTEASDFTRFLGDDVDAQVHMAAFRRLWLSDPRYGASDDLDVYRADYREAATLSKADALPTLKSLNDGKTTGQV